MNTDQVTTFFALLAVVAQLFVAACLGGFISKRSRRIIVENIGPLSLRAAACVACACMAGSLYLSEVAHLVPCKLCWFQRIGMYPTAILLAIGAIRSDRSVRPYAVTLSLLGGIVSAYHMLIERYPNLEAGSCDPSNPCNIMLLNKFGYLTIPTMAFTGFATIVLLLRIDRDYRATNASGALNRRM